MIPRRDFIIAGASAAAAGLSYELKPRKHFSLLGHQKMAAIVPAAFGRWKARDSGSLVKPETAGKLASRLYSEMVERLYDDQQTGAEIMMLIAYGDTQSDLLQLHRPESCYPAVGFRLLESKATKVSLGAGAVLPSRRVVAQKGDYEEDIVYWTRLGEYLPTGSGEQRKSRLLTAFTGYIPDGGLFRFSSAGIDREAAFPLINLFITDLIKAIPVADRRALLGTNLAAQLKAIPQSA